MTSKAVTDAGGVIVEILASAGGFPPSRTDLDNWINNYSFEITTVEDLPSLPLQSLNALYRREYCYIVDLSDMKILDVIVGTIVGLNETTSAYTGMQKMLALLGPKSG